MEDELFYACYNLVKSRPDYLELLAILPKSHTKIDLKVAPKILPEVPSGVLQGCFRGASGVVPGVLKIDLLRLMYLNRKPCPA